MKKVSFNTLGCRLNIAESGSLAHGFATRGYEIVEFSEEADVVVINTCTVTNKADSECRNIVRKAHKISPKAKIAVIGCYAQLAAAEVAEIEGVVLVLGSSEKHKIFEHLEKLDEDGVSIHVEESEEFYSAATQESDSHTRAFLKVQDGCNYFCSYCIIPFARGRARSIKVANAIEEAKELVVKGYKEVTLTGINIGEFSGSNGEKFEDLVAGLCEIDGLERIRLSSVEPNTCSDELLDLYEKNSKLMRHFHIPIQSGDATILKAMRRKYTLEEYRELVEKIASRFPDATIGTDVIIGFPGETEELFENTANFLDSLPITHYHVFPYSVRKGTKAEKLQGHLRGDVKKARVRRLMAQAERKYEEALKTLEGGSEFVLFERRNKNGFYEGFSRNYLKVLVDSKDELNNKIIKVELSSAGKDALIAKPI